MRSRLQTGARIALALALLAASAACDRQDPATPPPLVRIRAGQLDKLREAFNAQPERTRVLALLSPT